MLAVGPHNCRVRSFQHLVNLLWQPIIEHIEALSRDAAPHWKESLGLNQAAILSEMHGVVSSADETLDMDQWIEFIQKNLMRLLSVQGPTRLIMQVMSPIVPLSMQSTRANAL